MQVVRGPRIDWRETHRDRPINPYDQSAAEQYFPGENPIGRHLRLIEDNDKKLYEIIG
jgi:hypothetical protein